MNDDDNAFADFNTAIKLDGQVAESWANQALIYERRGDKAKAASSYARAGSSIPTTSRRSKAWRAPAAPDSGLAILAAPGERADHRFFAKVPPF